MPILVGREGVGKTSVVRIVATLHEQVKSLYVKFSDNAILKWFVFTATGHNFAELGF